MNGRHIFGLACLGSLAAIALAGAAAAQETTVIEQHQVVRAPPPPPQPAAGTHKTTVVRTTGAPPPRKAVVHKAVVHKVRRPAAVVEHATAVAAAPAPREGEPVATIDRKTVIHKDADGGVTRETRVERQDANGDTTVVRHSSQTPPDPDAAPPSPEPQP